MTSHLLSCTILISLALLDNYSISLDENREVMRRKKHEIRKA